MQTKEYITDRLNLQINYYGNNSIEVNLFNKQYSKQKETKFKQILLLISFYGAYFIVWHDTKLLNRIGDLLFILLFLHLTISTFNLIKNEKLLYCLNFALQIQTERFLGRQSNIFIRAADIYDIKINEVIENLDIHYILIARLKGDILRSKAILSIFNDLHPPVEFIEIIYKHLNDICKETSIN